MPSIRPLSVCVAGLSCLAPIGVLTVAGLIAADWREVRYQYRSLPGQLAAAIDHGDRLHYVVHLTMGRLADLTPWTESVADDQYFRAAQHARTDRQAALVTTERPTMPRAHVLDMFGLLESGVHWADAAGSWVVRRVIS